MPARNPTETLIKRIGRLSQPLGLTDGKWYSIADDFSVLPPIGAVAAGRNPNFSGTGTGTVPAFTFVTPSSNGLGGISVVTRTTSAADNDAARLTPFAGSAWGKAIVPVANNEQELVAFVKTPASLTDFCMGFGWKLTDTEVLATDNDQAYFLIDSDATTPAGSTTQIVCVNSVGGTDLVATSGVTTAVSTWYKLRVNVGTNLKARFYINDALVATATTAFGANVSLIPSFFVVSRANAGAATAATIGYIRRSVYTA